MVKQSSSCEGREGRREERERGGRERGGGRGGEGRGERERQTDTRSEHPIMFTMY